MKLSVAVAAATGLLLAVPAQAKIEKAPWGETADHQKVDIYTLTNKRGASVRITNYGAFLVSLNMPDRSGKMADVVLWNGNPFSVYTRPEKVWVDGALLYDANDPKRRPVSDFELGQPGSGDIK